MYIHIIYIFQGMEEKIVNKKGDKSDKKKKNNKNSQLILRLDKDAREEFVDLCKKMDTSAAREIRRFIRDFIKKNK